MQACNGSAPGGTRHSHCCAAGCDALHSVARTRFGQYTYAVGGNEQSAARAGINVRRHKIVIYMLAATFAAIGGLVHTARFSAGSATAGELMLLNSIAAVVIGGASLFGGTGNR
jgi:inositol transport system permease protein